MSESSSHDGGKATVYAALFANLGIAVTKFIAAALSGSSAKLAAGIHTTVDTANEGFLLLGVSRGKRPADAQHRFGHAGEVFFSSFILAVLISALGAGLSIYEGVRAILHGGHEPDGVPWIPFDVPEILHVNEIRSLHLGPHQLLLTLSIDFADDVVSQRIEAIVIRLDRDIRDRFDTVHSVFLEVQSRDGHRAIAAAEPKVRPA